MSDETDRSEPRRLLRSRDDRMLAGVAGGLGRYFAVDPAIVRIGFVVSVFFGGLGAFAYLALALFVPSADNDGEIGAAPIERSRGLAIAAGIGIVVIALSWGVFDGGWGWDGEPWLFGPPLILLAIGAGLYFLLRNTGNRSAAGVVGKVVLGLFVLLLAGCAAVFSAWAGATGHGVAVAGVVVAIGVLMAIAAFRGGARWLIAPAVVLAVPLGLVAAADISFGDGVGEREYRPTTFASVPDEYGYGVGQLQVDLRELPWNQNSVVELEVDQGIGETVIAVPEGVCVSAHATAGAGDLNIAGARSDGLDPEVDLEAPPQARPRLDLTAHIDLGAIRLVNDDDVEIDERHFDHFDHLELGDDEMEATMEAACAVEPPAEATGDGAGRKGGG